MWIERFDERIEWWQLTDLCMTKRTIGWHYVGLLVGVVSQTSGANSWIKIDWDTWYQKMKVKNKIKNCNLMNGMECRAFVESLVSEVRHFVAMDFNTCIRNSM